MTQFALEITDLKKTYDSDVVALKGINLSVTEGDFFALLGPNGAGKSSTIGIIASLVTTHSAIQNTGELSVHSKHTMSSR